MSIHLQLEPALESSLRQKASLLGKSVDELILQILEKETQPEKETIREDYLLQKVNLGIAVSKWERYHQLLKTRDLEQLEEQGRQELISISNEIEVRNAARMPYVFELANLRAISPEVLIQKLGLQ